MKQRLDELKIELVKLPSWIWITAIAILIIGILFVFLRNKKYSTRTLVVGAISLALSSILSFIAVFKLPQGGSITLASMLPIIAYAWAFGVAPGITAGLAFSFIQLMQGIYVVHPAQFAMDYILPFALLGLAGLSKKNLHIGVVIACVARFLSHYLSGIIFWGAYAPAGQPVWLYSLLYNGVYMLPEMIICLAMSFVPQIKKIAEQMNSSRLKETTIK